MAEVVLPGMLALLVAGNSVAGGLGWYEAILARWPSVHALGWRSCLTLVLAVGLCVVNPVLGVVLVALGMLVGLSWLGVVCAQAIADLPGGGWAVALAGYAGFLVHAGRGPQAMGALVLLGAWGWASWRLVPWLVRRGGWRAVFLLGPLFGVRFGDRTVRAMALALQALRHRPQEREGGLRWLEARVPATHLASQLLARGMLAAERGDAEGARRWMTGIVDLVPGLAIRPYRRAAAAWLCGDAARDGRWDDVLAHATAAPADDVLRFWKLAAECVLWTDAGSPEQCRRYVEAFCPRRARHLVERLVGLPGPEGRAPVGAGGVEGVLRRHLEIVRRPAGLVTVEDVGALALAWEAAGAAVAPVAVAEVADAGASVGVAGAAVAPGMREEVEADLLRLAREARIPLEALSREARETRMMGRIERRLCQDLHNEVSALATAISDRLEGGARLVPADAWVEWMSLRFAYERAKRIGGEGLAGMMWPQVHIAVNRLACRLGGPWDHPMFQWLMAEAIEREDDGAIMLESRNAQVRRPVPVWTLTSARSWVIVAWVLIGVVRLLTERGAHPSRMDVRAIIGTPSPRSLSAIVARGSGLPGMADVLVDGLRVGMTEREVTARVRVTRASGAPGAAAGADPVRVGASPEAAAGADPVRAGARVLRHGDGRWVELDGRGRVSAIHGGSVEVAGKPVVRVGDGYRAVMLAVGAGRQSDMLRGEEMAWRWRVAGTPAAELCLRFRSDCVIECVMRTLEGEPGR